MTTPRPRSTEPKAVNVPVEPIRPDSRGEAEDLSIISLVNTVLRHRWLILAVALVSGFYAGWRATRLPRLFTTEAQFMPKGGRGQSQIQGLAQQFGIAVGGGDAGQSPQFYMDLLESRPLLADVANREYRVRTDSGVITGNLAKVYRIRSRNPDVAKASVIGALRGQIDATTSIKTGVISVTVRSLYPDLSVQIARNLLDQVNVFNLNRRQEQAGAERGFIEKRLSEAQGELSRAEENLQAFLTENRDFKSSPGLSLEFDRLNRTVSSRQQLYNGLATSYEQAKIEEVRDLPVITVLEPPEYPIQPDPRGGKRRTGLGLLLGAFLGILLAFARDRIAANRDARSDEFAEFAELKRDAVSDLTHPWRKVSGLLARRKQS